MLARLKNIVNFGMDMLLPPTCPVTKQPVGAHGMVHQDVWQRLKFISAPMCDSCGIPLAFGTSSEKQQCVDCLENPPEYTQARAPLLYDDASMMLVLPFKYGDATSLNRTFAPWLMQAGRDILPLCDALAPVPLHKYRLIKRRYNQSLLLAQAVGKVSDVAVIHDLLLRVRSTPSQAQMSDRKGRAKNVSKAFVVNPKHLDFVKEKSFCLVDDVLTSGATANECAKALKDAGARTVYVLTVARVAKL